MRRLVWFTALATFSPVAFGQPILALTPTGANKLQNNYSFMLPGIPSYGIAQGSIFDIFGAGLATATSALQSVPLSTVLNGTSVNITINGTTVHPILYFVSDGQIAAILP